MIGNEMIEFSNYFVLNISIFRCKCGHCIQMDSLDNLLCCYDYDQMKIKVEEWRERAPGQEIQCITDHPGFSSGCLDPWVLEIAYSHYKQEHGHMAEQDQLA